MSGKKKNMKKKISEEEIDDVIVAESNYDSAWEEPVQVRRSATTSLHIPGHLASRAAFLAKLHREAGVEDWIVRIIRERIELEEVAFVAAKRELAAKASAGS